MSVRFSNKHIALNPQFLYSLSTYTLCAHYCAKASSRTEKVTALLTRLSQGGLAILKS